MPKVKPQFTKPKPQVKSTIYDVTPYLHDVCDLYTFSLGSADEYGKKAQTWSKTADTPCKVSYYTKAKEDILPMAYEEEELYLLMTEPNTLGERAYIKFKGEYYEILTIQQIIVKNVILYDRGVIRKAVAVPQGLPA